MSIPDSAPAGSSFKRTALLLVLFLLCLTLASVWSLDHLPLQDYPQNLFQAKLTSQVLSGHPLESPFYQVRVKATYSAFFAAIWLFQFVLPLSLAGKAAVSLYFILTAWAAWKTMWFSSRDGKPGWAAILLFPAAFNQIYFLGFFHFLYAMPLLLLAILHLLASAQAGWSRSRLFEHGLWLIVLLLVHPFAVAIYGLIVASWTLPLFHRELPPRRVVVGLIMAIVLAAAWLIPGLFGKAGSVSPHQVFFDSPLKNGAFALYLFTGMGGLLHPNVPALLLWCACIGLILFSCRRGGPKKRVIFLTLVPAGAILLAVLFSPFGTGNASYLNVRMTLAIYFLLVLLAAMVPLARCAVIGLVVLAVMLIANSFILQRRIAAETAEIEPLIAAMQPDAPILPLLFDRNSPALDGYYFSPHLHDHFYYQIQKGGVSPYLLEAPAEGRAPVFFRPGAQPPAPDQYLPTDFRWEKYGEAYRYFMVRGGSASLYHYMDLHANLRVVSGKWRLYEKR